jgi:RNA polymerase sigma factor (sigma-70 family)
VGTGWSDVEQIKIRHLDPSVDDAQFVLASDGDPEAFGELYDRHAETLYRYAARRLGPQPAEDVVAETFLVAYRKRRRFDQSRRTALPWLYGILTNEIAQHRRTERTRYRTLARTLGEQSVEGPADQVAAMVTAQAVSGPLATALSQLASRDRDVLLLVAWSGLTYAEVADALRIPIGTVRSRLSRARRTIRGAFPELAKYADAEEA